MLTETMTNRQVIDTFNNDDFVTFMMEIAPPIGRRYTSSRLGLIKFMDEVTECRTLEDYQECYKSCCY